jgi:hypothetical protein
MKPQTKEKLRARAEARQEYATAPLGVMLPPRVVAAGLGVARQTLEQWRTLGKGPKWIRISGPRVAYRKRDCEEWLATCEGALS